MKRDGGAVEAALTGPTSNVQPLAATRATSPAKIQKFSEIEALSKPPYLKFSGPKIASLFFDSSKPAERPGEPSGGSQRALLCKRCGEVLKPRQGPRGRFPQYCGAACRSAAMKVTARALEAAAETHAVMLARRALATGPCAVCGGEVPAGRAGRLAKYCSDRCRSLRKRTRYLPRAARTVTCRDCAGEFSVAGQGWPRVCPRCRVLRKYPGPRAVACEQCGRSFVVEGAGGPGLCSAECRDARRRARAAEIRLAKAMAEGTHNRVSPLTTKRLVRLARIARNLVENAPHATGAAH